MDIQNQIDNLDARMETYFNDSFQVLEVFSQRIKEASDHTSRSDNPHLLHKSHIGLESVINLPVASREESIDPDHRVGYITPYGTHSAITSRFTVLDRDFISLSQVSNYPTASKTEAEVGLSNVRYMTPLRTQQNFERNTDPLRGERGESFFLQEDNRPMMLAPGLVVNRNPALVQGSTEMAQVMGYIESFETVFDEWLRISHSGDTYPAVPEELTEWSYDPTEDTISSTINSTTLIGFISPDRHEDYIFDVIVSSTANDDDLIGICLGFVEEGGRQYTFTASRSAGGISGGDDTDATLFLIEYNRGQSDQKDIASTNGGLMWGDGVIDDDRPKGFTSNTGNNWDKYPTGCRIRVERFGDIFTIKTSDLGSDILKESATVVIDIKDFPELEKFRGPIQFGYVCQSQANSTWDTLRRPVELGTVVDADTLETWSWDGEQFVQVTDEDAKEIVPVNRLFYTEMTGKLYYHEPFKGIMKISGN